MQASSIRASRRGIPLWVIVLLFGLCAACGAQPSNLTITPTPEASGAQTNTPAGVSSPETAPPSPTVMTAATEPQPAVGNSNTPTTSPPGTDTPPPPETGPETQPTETLAEGQAGGEAPPYPTDLEGVVIEMSRTACFGFCPVYSVTIEGDGTVRYNGKTCVAVKGEETTTISQDQVRALVDAFYAANFFALQDRYTAEVTDLPSTTTTIAIDGQVKSVYNYIGAPEVLEQLEDQIDAIAQTDQWVRQNGEQAPCP